MSAALRCESVTPADLPAIGALLAAEALPVSDIGEKGRLFWRFRDASGATIGVGGLELYGADALLRSVAVVPDHRGRGYGRAIVTAVLREVAARRASRVFLLTASAADFFAQLGFIPMARDAVPAAIAATREFAALCPASAICMTRSLAP